MSLSCVPLCSEGVLAQVLTRLLCPWDFSGPPLKFQFLEFLLLICDACGGGFWGEDLEEIAVLLAGLCPQEVKMF